MNRFDYVRPSSVEQASTVIAEGKGAAVAKAGGIDLLDRMKEGLSAPSRLVNLGALPSLRHIELGSFGLRLGPTTTLAQIAAHPQLRAAFAALAQAAGSAANPQIRNVATVGGNLLQRPRCWYFRHADFNCLKKGGDVCFAERGENRYHAVFGDGPSYIVHPSTMATALSAFGAVLRLSRAGAKGKLESREVPIDRFFALPDSDETRENILGADELITEILVAAPAAGTRSAYVVAKEREAYDWPLGEAAVVLELESGKVKRASVVLGAAAPIPWRAAQAEQFLVGATPSAAVAAQAGKLAVAGARPLRQNGYKVPLLATLVERAVSSAAEVR